MNNLEIRQAIKESNRRHYEIAKFMNISENTLSRRLRYELSQEEKEKILKIIKDNRKEN